MMLADRTEPVENGAESWPTYSATPASRHEFAHFPSVVRTVGAPDRFQSSGDTQALTGNPAGPAAYVKPHHAGDLTGDAKVAEIYEMFDS